MPSLAELLREAGGQADATAQLLKGFALQPVAGLAGGSRALIDMLRGQGIDKSMQAGADTVENVSGWGGGPRTERGAQRLNELGGMLEHGTQAVGNALGNPIDKLGEVPVVGPGLAAAALGFVETADPGKGAGRAAKQAARVIDKAALPDALRGFGTAKAAREAATSKRVQGFVDTERVIERQKGAGTREKVDPDKFRQQYAAADTPEQGTASVMASALRGEHLKPQPAGGWVGAPRTVQTSPQLGAMRRSIDDQFNRGVDALEHADPERLGTWYDRAKAAQAQINEPHQLDRGLEGTAAYSAGVAPESELAFNLKHMNSRAMGTPEMAYRGAPMRTLDEAVAANAPADLAHKVGEYRSKNDPRVQEVSPFGVNDFRMAQTFGYTDPAGNPWKAGVSSTMHPFMDAETALAVGRANKRTAGGKGDWTGATMQEIPWVLNKAEDIYGRGKQGRFAGGQEGMAKALREANNTVEDYLPKHAASATYEYKTGANVGHLGDESGAPGYGQQGAWATPAPMDPVVAGMPANVGAGNRDALYRAAGLRQQPTIEGVGQYTNSQGQIENNPLHIARPLLDFQTVGEGRASQAGTVNPNTLAAMKAIEGMRGTIDAQEASAMNLPVTTSGRMGQSSTLLERGSLPNADELKALTDMLRGTDHGVTPTNRGALVMNFGGKMPKGLEQAMPGATARKAAYEGLYEPGVSPASEAGQGTATARTLQRFADAPPEVAKNIGESDEVRDLIRKKIERDEALGGGRRDIQNTRNFMAESDWPRAVDMIRKGMKPAAAVAVLGYSLQGMAAEDRQRLENVK